MKTSIRLEKGSNIKVPRLYTSTIPNEDRVLFLGNISFKHSIHGQRIDKSFQKFVLKHGINFFFQKVKGLLVNVDTVVANLETPIMKNKPVVGISTFPSDKQKAPQYLSNGTSILESLKEHNIFAVSLANNHLSEYGQNSLNETISMLKMSGIRYFGANINARRARTPLMKRVFIGNRNLKLVIISAYEDRTDNEVDLAIYANKDRSGVNRLSINKIKEKIQSLRKSSLDDEIFVVAYPHWGGRRNYGWKTKSQKKIGQRLIEAGADIVIGQGPRNLQEIDIHQGHPILYSIGNFISDALGKYHEYNAFPFSLAVELNFRIADKNAQRTCDYHQQVTGSFEAIEKFIKLYPILTDNRTTNFQTRLVNETEFGMVYKVLIDNNSTFKSGSVQVTSGIDKIGHYIELPLK